MARRARQAGVGDYTARILLRPGRPARPRGAVARKARRRVRVAVALPRVATRVGCPARVSQLLTRVALPGVGTAAREAVVGTRLARAAVQARPARQTRVAQHTLRVLLGARRPAGLLLTAARVAGARSRLAATRPAGRAQLGVVARVQGRLAAAARPGWAALTPVVAAQADTGAAVPTGPVHRAQVGRHTARVAVRGGPVAGLPITAAGIAGRLGWVLRAMPASTAGSAATNTASQPWRPGGRRRAVSIATGAEAGVADRGASTADTAPAGIAGGGLAGVSSSLAPAARPGRVAAAVAETAHLTGRHQPGGAGLPIHHQSAGGAAREPSAALQHVRPTPDGSIHFQ